MQSVNQEIRELKEQVQSLADIVQKKIKHIPSNGVDHDNDNIFSHLNREELAEMARKAGKDVRSFIKDNRAKAEEVYEEVEKKITHHPFQAMAAAVAGGALLGLLMSNRR
jgi:ElaB/YqjD/DUF883 family membrane-anchored ribosome-binding protein